MSDDADADWWIRSKTVEELISRAGRCTELSCPYHGVFNRELRRRRLERESAEERRHDG